MILTLNSTRENKKERERGRGMTAKSIPLDELCDDSQDAELEVCPGRVEEERVTEETKVKPHTLGQHRLLV